MTAAWKAETCGGYRSTPSITALKAMGVSLTPDLLWRCWRRSCWHTLQKIPALRSHCAFDTARRAAAMGVLDGQAMKALYASAAIDVSTVSNADALIRSEPENPLTLAAAVQSVASKSAPEFIRDRAAMIADAIAKAPGFSRKYAASLLFADDIAGLDGAIVDPAEAESFALARMMIGDAAGAEKWLTSVAGGGDLASLAGYLSLLTRLLQRVAAKSRRCAAAAQISGARRRPGVGRRAWRWRSRRCNRRGGEWFGRPVGAGGGCQLFQLMGKATPSRAPSSPKGSIMRVLIFWRGAGRSRRRGAAAIARRKRRPRRLRQTPPYSASGGFAPRLKPKKAS
ncbi:MAG: hypothetical protein R3C60_12530 [Parvularculaceae bacterium]